MTAPVVFSVNPMIADMDPVVRRVVGDRVELATIQGAGLWPVRLRPGELEQALLALVISACDAMPSGGTLRITTCNVTLDEEYARRFQDVAPGDYVLLEVADTGPGLSDSAKARILESFLAPTAAGQATALAFSMTYGMLRRAGGHLELAGAAGAGTVVRVYLPRAGAAVAPAEAREVANLPGGTETILVVEDETSLLNLTSRILTRLGYGVLKAASGEDALRFLGAPTSGGSAPAAGQTIRLLLTDIMLTGMDGLALSRMATERRPAIKVVFMSGHSAEAMRLAEAAGPEFTLLQKPYTVAELAQAVRAALDGAA
ncbi:MAG: response regulator [Gemmatimonadales bacterium]|jgi:CheY-like chemotaxis protein